jgi:hypothetical protein
MYIVTSGFFHNRKRHKRGDAIQMDKALAEQFIRNNLIMPIAEKKSTDVEVKPLLSQAAQVSQPEIVVKSKRGKKKKKGDLLSPQTQATE